MSRDRGALALLLHTHMPYVEGFGTWPFGEEWLWEAVASAYMPLVPILDGAPVTVSLTPVLCDQFETLRGDAGDRYLRFLREIRAPIHAEDSSGLDATGKPELAAELRRAAGDYVFADEEFERRGGDLVGAFAGLGTELWTSSATHAVLPMLATDAGLRLQVAGGIASHEWRFGEDWSGGFWLPECAYRPGLERDLADFGVRAFCVDQTEAWGHGAPDHLEPVATPSGSVAVPLDWQTVELIWGVSGYPSHRHYRDYHGRTLHDLKPWTIGGEPYDHDRAVALAGDHAEDFVGRVVERLDRFAAERGKPGLVCCPIDTELLGHWWYEGPVWLRAMLEQAAERGLDLVTLPAGLERVDPVERDLTASTWGSPKDLTTWDSARVAEIAFTARNAELATVAAAASGSRGPALERATRELLALQSSDWAFLMTRELAADYPLERVRAHDAELRGALRGLDSAPQTAPELRSLAPQLDLAPLVTP